VNDEPAHIPQLCKRSGTGKTSRGNSSHVLLLHQKTWNGPLTGARSGSTKTCAQARTSSIVEVKWQAS
jgi:hypothetical protein